MKKLKELFQSKRFTDILSWVFIIGLGIGIVVLLDNLDLAKKDKYLVGKGIKWLLILVPWLCLKIYNLFTKKGEDEGTYVQEAETEEVVSEEETKVEEAQEESQQVTAPVAEEQIDFIPANESKWSILVTAIIVGSIIIGGGYWMLKDKIKLHKPGATYSYSMGDEKKMSFEDGYYCYVGLWKGKGEPRHCKIEFEKVGDGLMNCFFTDLTNDTRRMLYGEITDDKLLYFKDEDGSLSLFFSLPTTSSERIVGENTKRGDRAEIILYKDTKK